MVRRTIQVTNIGRGSLKHALACFLLLLGGPAVFGQTTIKGKVVDARTSESIIGASVELKSKAGGGVVTNLDGAFTLSVSEELPVTLRVSFIGYRQQDIDVYEAGEPVTVELLEDYNLLNEVVVVGYGTQKRKELTGSVTTISKERLAQPVISVNSLLSGAAAGVNISEGGQPGSTFSVRIRGGNSINAGNEPLFVIDGVILYGNSATDAGVSQLTASLNPLAAINPNDIESIEILKDVSATAIYGSRGSNGVVIITTKSGQRGKDKIEYQYSIGWQQASKKLDLLNGTEWDALYREIGGEYPAGYTPGASYDWQDEALRTATVQTHQISLSGGDEKTRYLISGNFTDQDGILLNTGLKRYTGRLNLDRNLRDNLNVSLNLNASKLNQHGLNNYPTYAGYGNPLEAVIRNSPLNPIYNADGTFNYHNIFERGDLRSGDVTTNAIADLVNTTAQNITNSLLGNFALRYTVIPGLELKLSAGTNITNATQNFYAPSSTAGGFGATNGYASVGNRRTDVWQYEYTLNYTKQLGRDHFLNALAGYTTQNTTTEYAVAQATNFANEQVLWHSLQSGNTFVKPLSGASESILHSVIGRLNYTFRQRYNLTATFRADGSSRFAKNNKWGYFPSIGLSWNISEEAFLRRIRNLDELKLRASFGTVGNQEIGDYKYEALYGTTNVNDSNRNQVYSFGGQLTTGYLRTNLENPDLKWEQTASYNIGIDASLFQHRLSFTADVYYKKTTDLLLNTPTLIQTGFSTRLRNVGDISNKGLELEARGVIIDRKDLKWDLTANFAKNINRVLSLAPGQENIGTTIFVGQPLGVHYLVESAGIVQTPEEAAKTVGPSWKPTVEVGDEKFVNQNGDDVVNETGDRVILGTSNPDVTYGFSTTLTWKALSLFVAFQGVSGNQIYNSLRQSLESPNTSNNGLATLVDRWTSANPSTTIPKASKTSSTFNTSRFLEDGAYLRLKNITLTYALPARIQALPTARISLFASAQNLLTFTKFTGYDPETGGGFGYPQARTVSLGVNLSY
ncbi:MAG: TonB-dependent receptor [Mediterranea sp.]|jgi:TonB-linked SusC/RagA family outer membrane protein|nr:TonB-dependent receptor [Mediterranea sp.]